ncbi:glutamyl-tRNA(Gln) amidotransferase, subunit D, partial [mine drainage metagenome]
MQRRSKGKIVYLSDYRKVERTTGKKVSAETKFEPKVALVKAYPNSDPGVIEYYSGKGYKGIIIEGTGLGHVPTTTSIKEYSWIGNVKKAVDLGIIVAATSQCLYGRVNSNVYRNLRMLRDAGAVYCEDMLPEVAQVKLGVLIGNYGVAKAQEMLNKNMAGEITARTEFDFP